MATRRLILLPLRHCHQPKWIVGFGTHQSNQASHRNLRVSTSAYFSTSTSDSNAGDALSVSEFVGSTAPRLFPVLPTPAECCPSSAQRTNKTRAAATSSSAEIASNATARTAKPKKFLDQLWDRYSFTGHRHRVVIAESMFQAASHQASDPRWFGPGRLSRDFRPRHALLTMHFWFLHKRLISDTIDKHLALMIQEELFNILWDDTTSRIRLAGVNEWLVNKNLLQVQQYTFMHLTHYDHCYTEFLQKPAERLNELRKLIWWHIFGRDKDAEFRYDHLDRIAWYVEANYQNIVMDWPDDYYRQGRVAWVDLPDFSNIKDIEGNVLPENPIHPDDVLPKPWLRNITKSGLEYYWNPVTKRATWDRPTNESQMQ